MADASDKTNNCKNKSDCDFKNFKMPTLDTNAILDSYKKNLEIVDMMNKMSMEVCDGIVKLQTAFVKQAMADINGMERCEKPADTMARFSDIARDNIVRSIENGRKMSDMISAANNDITAAAARRFKESVAEAKDVINKKK